MVRSTFFPETSCQEDRFVHVFVVQDNTGLKWMCDVLFADGISMCSLEQKRRVTSKLGWSHTSTAEFSEDFQSL